MKESVAKVELKDRIMYCPCYILNDKEYLVSHQGELKLFETEEKALEYFK